MTPYNCVCGQREEDYGSQPTLGARCGLKGVDITLWTFRQVKSMTGQQSRKGDIAGYAACGGEIEETKVFLDKSLPLV